MTVPIRVVIADDQAMIRDGIAVLLSSSGDIEVVGEAADGQAAIAVTAQLRPDVVVMDIRMPVLDGLRATDRIIRSRAEGQTKPRVLVLTTFDLDEYVYDALTAGASGFLLKDASARELIEAVKVIDRGDAMLAPSVTRRLLADFTARRGSAPAGGSSPEDRSAAVDKLTPREVDVVKAMAQGLSNSEIAQALFLSEQTIKSHVAHILVKLTLRDRTQVAIFAYQHGLAG
ncbi:MAG: response regulator transcription factor [Propionibacteriaceae bacterium]|jgi:DNA-binding NarL/FixJ family response regulator|nr:response regulator transcription factor [Propionibacteriaceae bacterium]